MTPLRCDHDACPADARWILALEFATSTQDKPSELILSLVVCDVHQETAELQNFLSEDVQKLMRISLAGEPAPERTRLIHHHVRCPDEFVQMMVARVRERQA